MDFQNVDHVKPERIQELMGLADELNQFDVVESVYGSLKKSFDQFKSLFEHGTLEFENLGRTSHSLKNQFANFGCERASQILDEIYRNTKSSNAWNNDAKGLVNELIEEGDVVLAQVQNIIHNYRSHL